MSLKKLTNITKNQIANKGVQALANRPNAAQQYGVAGLSPTDLKLWFDKLATFLADKINEVQNAISADDAASYIRIALDQYDVASLGDLVKSMQDGSFAQNILQIIPPNRTEQVSISYFLTDLCQKLSKAVEDISNLQKDKLNKVVEKADKPRAYVVDENGDQKMIPVTKSPGSTGEIPAYDDGKLSASTPENAKHVVNKEYFEKILQSYVSGSVYNEGVKELTKQIKTVNDNLQSEIDKIDNELGIVQTTGDSKYSAMSQWATTNAINRISKRVDNIASFGVIDPYETDDSVAYAKIVPEGALPYAEVAKIGGMSYRDETAGVLKNAVVTRIDSVLGNNLVRFPYISKSKTSNGVTYTVNDDGSIKVTGTATGYSAFSIGKVYLEKGTYFASSNCGIGTNGSLPQMTILGDGVISPGQYNVDAPRKITIVASGFVSLTIHCYINNVCDYTFYPMINSVSLDLPYEKYNGAALEIPTEVQALDGYGLGVNSSYHNFIDWQNKTWSRWIKRIIADGNTPPTMYTGSSGKKYFSLAHIDTQEMLSFGGYYPSLCNKYPIVTAAKTYDGSATGVALNVYGAITLYDETIQTVEAMQAKLKEWFDAGTHLEFIYAIKTPIVTDISDLLSDDNFIEVSEGGLVIAENADGLDAPTTIVYQTEGITSMFPDGDEVSY